MERKIDRLVNITMKQKNNNFFLRNCEGKDEILDFDDKKFDRRISDLKIFKSVLSRLIDFDYRKLDIN